MNIQKKTEKEIQTQAREFLNYLPIVGFIKSDLKEVLGIRPKLGVNPKDFYDYMNRGDSYYRSNGVIRNINMAKKAIENKQHDLRGYGDTDEIYDLYKDFLYLKKMDKLPSVNFLRDHFSTFSQKIAYINEQDDFRARRFIFYCFFPQGCLREIHKHSYGQSNIKKSRLRDHNFRYDKKKDFWITNLGGMKRKTFSNFVGGIFNLDIPTSKIILEKAKNTNQVNYLQESNEFIHEFGAEIFSLLIKMGFTDKNDFSVFSNEITKAISLSYDKQKNIDTIGKLLLYISKNPVSEINTAIESIIKMMKDIENNCKWIKDFNYIEDIIEWNRDALPYFLSYKSSYVSIYGLLNNKKIQIDDLNSIHRLLDIRKRNNGAIDSYIEKGFIKASEIGQLSEMGQEKVDFFIKEGYKTFPEIIKFKDISIERYNHIKNSIEAKGDEKYITINNLLNELKEKGVYIGEGKKEKEQYGYKKKEELDYQKLNLIYTKGNIRDIKGLRNVGCYLRKNKTPYYNQLLFLSNNNILGRLDSPNKNEDWEDLNKEAIKTNKYMIEKYFIDKGFTQEEIKKLKESRIDTGLIQSIELLYEYTYDGDKEKFIDLISKISFNGGLIFLIPSKLKILLKGGITKADELGRFCHYNTIFGDQRNASADFLETIFDSILNKLHIPNSEKIEYLKLLENHRANENEDEIIKMIKELTTRGFTAENIFDLKQNIFMTLNTKNIAIFLDIFKKNNTPIEKVSEYLGAIKEVLQYARPENLKIIIDIVHSANINLSENIEILNTLYNSQPENLKIIIDNVSKNPDNFKKLQKVLQYSQSKNLQIIIDNVSKNPDDLINLQNVLQSAQPENLQESITKYNPSIEELLQIQEFIINSEERKTIQKRHPKITLEDLILLNEKTKQTKDRKLSLNLLNFRQKYYTEGAELLSNLLKDRTSNSSEIFAKIEIKGEVNEDNRIEITCLYSALEYFDENNEFSKEVKTGIREIFKQERSDKDFIYHKLEEKLQKVLAEGVKSLDNKEIALIEIVNKKGVFNLPMLENITKFLYQIKELEEREGTFGTTKGNIRERIKKFLIKNKKRSSEDLNEFYNISKNILKTSPSIYNKILLIFDELQPSDIKYFHEYIFPLYNVELVLQEKNNKHEIQSLIKVNSDIKKLRKMLEENKNKKEILDNKKEELVENIKKLFKDKFGIIKVPDPITKENVESIKNYSLYLANLHDKTPEKETILGFFLAIKINNKRNDFRTGKEDIQPEEFMAPEKTYIIKEYLQKRKNLDIIQGLGYEEKTRKVLQEGEVSKMLGSTENISDRLRNIEQDINSLLDNDMYQGEDVLIKNYLEKYPDFGSIMSLKYQQLEGKKQLSEEQNKIIKEFEQEIGKHLSQEDIIRIQKSLKGISPIMNFVKKIQEMELKREIQEFEIMRIPDTQLIRIFNKLGENFSTESGVMGVTEDIQYLEGIIKEDTIILTNEEKNIAKTYIESIKKELNDLYKIQDTTQELFTNFKKHIENSNNEQIKNRLKEIEPLFTKIQEGKKENIVSTMTSDLDIVIKNIRACLSCTSNGCNNDTNLSFGTNNKFFITTNSNNSEKSYADELVILLPSNKGMVFVMDQVYGKRNPDVLVNNTLTILKKIRKMGGKDIGILISNPAISGCGLTKEHLETKMTEEGIKDIIIEKDDNITLEVPEQPIGDGYYEFGGISSRGKGEATTGGLLLHLK